MSCASPGYCVHLQRRTTFIVHVKKKRQTLRQIKDKLTNNLWTTNEKLYHILHKAHTESWRERKLNPLPHIPEQTVLKPYPSTTPSIVFEL